MTSRAAPIYDAYAPIYDAIGQGHFSARMAAWTLRWLARRGARPARMIDLACGAGEAALVFAAAGCTVVGVDRSAPMLEIARGKTRGAGYEMTLVEDDIRMLLTKDERRKTKDERHQDMIISSFVLRPSSFDLVTCFYDSLNYLIEDDDLDRVFAGVAEMLRPGGYLVFDLNTAAEYLTWDERDVVTYDGRDCLVYNRLSYDPAARLATGRIVWFVRETERWWRGEETHVERAWSDDEVCAALAGAQLALVERLDIAGAEVAAGAPDVARVIYVGRRLNGEGAQCAEVAEGVYDRERNPE